MLRSARPSAPPNPLQREPIAHEVKVLGRRVLDALQAGEGCQAELERLHALSTLADNLDQTERLFDHAVTEKKRKDNSAKGGRHSKGCKGIRKALDEIAARHPQARTPIDFWAFLPAHNPMHVQVDGDTYLVHRDNDDWRVYQELPPANEFDELDEVKSISWHTFRTHYVPAALKNARR